MTLRKQKRRGQNKLRKSLKAFEQKTKKIERKTEKRSKRILVKYAESLKPGTGSDTCVIAVPYDDDADDHDDGIT